MKRSLLITALSIVICSLPSLSASGKSIRGDHEIVIAASNSSKADKASADYVCSGKNDEKVIQKAIDRLGRYGEIRFLSGVYMIDSFTATEDGTPYYAIGIKGEGHSHNGKEFPVRIIMRGADASFFGFALTPEAENFNGVVFAVSQECYDALDAERTYSVIRSVTCRDTHLDFEGISLNLPDNQKNIIGLDGSRFESIRMKDCYFQASDKNIYDENAVPHLGVLGCVGVRGVQGSNNSFKFDLFNVACMSFGVGFEIGGEHYYGVYLSSVFCTYGFTFNSYPLESGVWVHPITLINCCDEAPGNFPLFGDNPGHQPVDIINFNMEQYLNYFEAGGANYAKETVPGQWTGTFDYSIMSRGEDGYFLTNSPKKRFWEDGSGLNIKTKDNTQKQVLTTEERLTYEPNMFQVVYDTTMEKLLICVDPATKKWQTLEGTVVE